MKLKTPVKIALLFAGLAALVVVSLFCARIIGYTGGHFGSGALGIALVRAVQAGDRTTTRVLLLAGVSPDTVQPGTGHSPISIAAHRGDAWAVRLLLDHGANANGADTIVDNFSVLDPQIPYRPGVPQPIYLTDRPICMAARGGHAEIVALLRGRGARYEFIDALFIGDEPFARDALAKDGALAQAFDRAGPRMLKLAVEENNLAAARLMLELGVDPARTPEYGSSPMEMAQLMNRAEFITLFKSHVRPSPSVDGDPIDGQ